MRELPWTASRLVTTCLTLAAVIALAGCDSRGPTAPNDDSNAPPDPPAPVETYVVSGVVVDSATQFPIEGAELTVAGLSDLTDATGAFRVEEVPAGVQPASLRMYGYQDQEGTIEVDDDVAMNDLWMWRHLPVIKQKPIILSSMVLAIWEDADGDFPEGAPWVSISGPGFSISKQARSETILGTTARQYEWDGEPNANRVALSLTDQAGHTTEVVCTPQWFCEEQ